MSDVGYTIAGENTKADLENGESLLVSQSQSTKSKRKRKELERVLAKRFILRRRESPKGGIKS